MDFNSLYASDIVADVVADGNSHNISNSSVHEFCFS
jgi:hypothetical protein